MPMSSPSDPVVESSPSARSTGTHPAVSAMGSGLLLWASFPPADWGWLAWVALVPLFLLVGSRRGGWTLAFASWTGGMVFWTLAIQWVRLTDATAWVGWLVMAFVLSLSWPLFLWLTRRAIQRLALPRMLVAPLFWVGLEYGRAHVLSGFPWYYLAHSQHAVLPLIQVADFASSLGVSLLIALVNAWLADALSLPLLRPTPKGVRPTPPQQLRLAVVVAALGGTLAYGGFRLATSEFRPGPRVMLLQSSIPQRLKMGGDPNKLLGIFHDLIERGLHAGSRANPPHRPDLIVWPETSYPFSIARIDPATDDPALASQLERLAPAFSPAAWRERAESVAAVPQGWADQMRVPMLVGSLTYQHSPTGAARYNSALLFAPGASDVTVFHKLHLVPFGEYVPFIKLLPWLTLLTPYRSDEAPSLAFGPGPVWFDVGPYRYASAICFEDTVPHTARRFFAEVREGRQPDVLVNLSNDGWFVHALGDGRSLGSSEQDMHLVVSVFRCVENRVPLARSANTGVSAIIDGNGRVVQALETMREGVVEGVVPLDDRVSLYSSWGDWLGQTCLAILVGLTLMGALHHRPSRRVAATSPTFAT